MKKYLSDIKEGEQFRIREHGSIWIKKSSQGMHNQLAYCISKEKMKQRNTHMNFRHKYIRNDEEVFTV